MKLSESRVSKGGRNPGSSAPPFSKMFLGEVRSGSIMAFSLADEVDRLLFLCLESFDDLEFGEGSG